MGMKKNESPIVKGILQEELDRVRSLKGKYEQKLKDYPPGYLLKRRVGKREYYYLSFREGDRIRQRYLGSLSLDELKAYRHKIEDKKALRGQLAEVKQNIRYLERLLRK